MLKESMKLLSMFFKTYFGMFHLTISLLYVTNLKISLAESVIKKRETKEGRSIDYYPKKEEKMFLAF